MYVREVASFSLRPTASVRDAMVAIQSSGAAACCLVGRDGFFENIITDGDLRRALLAGLPLDATVSDVLALKSRRVMTVSVGIDDSVVLAVMKRNQLRQLPILDEFSRVVAVAVLTEGINQGMGETTAVIMAGGRGTRLGPLTTDCPKPMLPVAGKPMLEHIVKRLIAQGVSRFFISVHYLSNVIKDYFGNGDSLGVTVEYLMEDEPLGTAGALALIPKTVGGDFIVTNGDILTSVDYTALRRFHEQSKLAITICSVPYQVEVPFGVLQLREKTVDRLVEKPTFQYQVSAGIYYLSNRTVIDLPTPAPLDMPTLINRALSRGAPVGCFPIIESWADVGTPSEYSRVSAAR